MNLNRYDKTVNNLIQQMFHQKKTMDEGVFETLTELMAAAEGLQDDGLLGFTHYHLADALYAYEVDYAKFRQHMTRAVALCIKADENEILTRAYNYLGVDAFNQGAFNVAYYHLMNALTTSRPLRDKYLQSLVNHNIGQVYARMNNNEKAIEYVRLSNKLQFSEPSDDAYYYQNAINGYFSEGVLNVFLGDLEEAKRLEKVITQLEGEFGVVNLSNVVIPVAILRLQIAVTENDQERIEEFREKTMHLISDAHRVFDYITDIRDLCMYLIEYDYTDIVRGILDAISEAILSSDIWRMKQHLYAIEIAYYEKLGNQDEVARILLEQHHANLEQEKEYFSIHQTSMELIDMMNDLREQHRILEEQVLTDALTGIPNRRSMEMSIYSAFERAFANRTNFAIEILDINSFKEYNDFYGHKAGDSCLQIIAAEIGCLAEEEGIVCARYGGDEFVLIYEDKSDEEILSIAQKLENRVSELKLTHEHAQKLGCVSVSQGICNDVPRVKVKSWDFFTKADDALYEVKSKYYAPGDYSYIHIVKQQESEKDS